MMKSITLAVLIALASPLVALAQTNDTAYMDYWQRSSPYQSEIKALGDTAVSSIAIPVVLGVEVNQLTKNFGDPRGNGTRTHEGLDIMAPAGTPVVSPTDAVVLVTGDGASSGLYIRTANPGGEEFVYMHLREVAKGLMSGTQLKRGDVIGFVGNTGDASGGAAHLHFEIRRGGATDPYPRLTQVFSVQERMSAVSQALEKATDPAALAHALASNFSSSFDTAKSQGIAVAQSILSTLGSGIAVGVTTAEAATPLTAPTATGYSRDLEIGMKGDDVRKLQKYLNANGYLITNIGDGSPGYETTMFGSLTKKALITFQNAKGILPSAGYFGPKTRAYVASH